MVTPLTLPRSSWGDPAAVRQALLVHGLGSDGALMWRFGVTLADDGWFAVAVDLRGHGIAPRGLDYTLEAYAADVGAVRPDGGAAWDAVIGHSLGGAASTLAAAADPAWARRLVLIDPAIRLTDEQRQVVRDSQTEAFDEPTVLAVRRDHPHWHELDVELKAAAAAKASRWAVEQTDTQNPTWDVRDAASRLVIPTHVIASDPDVYTLFDQELEAEVRGNPAITVTRVDGAGHSLHRDRPDESMRQLRAALEER